MLDFAVTMKCCDPHWKSQGIGMESGHPVNTPCAESFADNRVITSIPNSTPVSNADTTIYDYEIEPYLRNIRSTSPGPDLVPGWVYRLCSVELSAVVSSILSSSISQGSVPTHWRKAFVTPVPKVNKRSCLDGYRPISVTPILSGLAEQIVVRRWLLSSIQLDIIQDQFALRPTGSTTAALVSLFHHVATLLESNDYVRCLCIDFPKAFDIVDHGVLVQKLAGLRLPEQIYMWIFSFLGSTP